MMNEYMRIAIFTDTFHPHINGVVTAITSLAQGLEERGHEVLIIAPKNKKAQDSRVFRSVSVPIPLYQDFQFSIPNPQTLSKVRSFKPDIIHFHTPFSLGAEAIVIAKILKKPLLGTYHTFFADPKYLSHLKINTKHIKSLAQKYTTFFYNRCNLVTCPSQSAKKELLSTGCKRQIKIISNGIDPKIFSDEKKLQHSGPILLYVGRLAQEKSLDVLIESMRYCRPQVKLFIIGDGPQKEEYVKQAKGLPIQFLDAIEHDELLKGYYSSADVFVTPSTTETQGITVLEALANKVPVIAARAGGLKYLIQHKKNGLLVTPDNPKKFAQAINTLLEDKELYAHCKNNALLSLEKHHMTKVLDTWEKVYKNLIPK